MVKSIRLLSLLCCATLLASACGLIGGDDGEETVEGTGEDETVASDISVADARLTVRSERDVVTVNGQELASGSFQEGAAGDVVQVDGAGTATITAESVFEIEGLRSAAVTVPDLSAGTLEVGLEVGHVFVRLNPEANVTLVVDAGERQFTTLTPDAEFALCQAPDGASCLAVLNGEVEWNENDVATETYSAGRASFAERGNAPEPDRCADADQIGEMKQSLRGQEFTGALANIVATWETCPAGEGETDDLINEVSLPSAARMERVVLDELVVGSPDVDADSESGIAQKTLDGSVDFYIEPLSVTNGEFRTWLVNAAGDDAEAWRRFAPQDWLDRAPGGAATQATFVEGGGDDAVKGVGYGTAVEFCAAQAKRLPTEVEWELAATAEVIEDLADESQDWVSDWESYGPGPEDSADRQVLRGANSVLGADPYFRVFALDTPEATAARQNARIRCAADEVAIGGQAFTNIVVKDDFNSLDWLQLDEDPFELDYHPENYHLDLTAEHSQGAVVRALEAPISDGRVDVDLFIERNNTGADTGSFRFGTVLGTATDLYILTLQPDNFAGDRFLACLMPIDPELATNLSLVDSPLSPDSSGRAAVYDPGEGHYGENCEGAATSKEVAVSSIDSPVRISAVVGGGASEIWVNDVLVENSGGLSEIEIYGFYSQIYHRPRTHIHFDDLIISN